jgi:hypothetical protein
MKSNKLTDKKLKKLRDWLQSDEGKQILKEALIKADETCDIINKMNDIDIETLRTPFNI